MFREGNGKAGGTNQADGGGDAKLADLRELLRGLRSVAVAFSAGVDSTFLLHVAHEVLGDGAVAVTVCTPLLPRREMDEVAAFCRAGYATKCVFRLQSAEKGVYYTRQTQR